jgi:hypothetical protein
MENRLSRWGVGPRIVSLTLPCAIMAGITTRIWPNACRLRIIPGIVLVALAVVFLAAVLIAVISMKWIVLILPGFALLSPSWPLLLMPVVAYITFKLTIHQEDEYQQQRFGQACLDYRNGVNELFQFP